MGSRIFRAEVRERRLWLVIQPKPASFLDGFGFGGSSIRCPHRGLDIGRVEAD